MKERIGATLSIERELEDALAVVEYRVGNGDFHFHSRVEICVVESGTVDALVNNSQRVLQAGDIAVSLGYDSHRYITRDAARYSVLVLSYAMSEKLYAAIGTKSLQCPFIRKSASTAKVPGYLASLKGEEGSELARLGYAYLILDAVCAQLLAEPSADAPDRELLSSLLMYIHKNYEKKLTLPALSRVFGYHPGYISAYFKSCLDIGIARYINMIRLKNALRLMREGKGNMTEIALDCGFNSTRTFYRAFRNEFHCSPKEYLARPI